jgi:DNA-binding transcriptional LysR family regulator
MAVFAKVVGAGSLSSAARELGLSPALVSRKLAALEARLGVRLINRTTRSLHLTDEGASYFEACSRLLAEIDEADAAVAAGRVEPQGVLRVALPASFGHLHVAPRIPAFAAQYPKVRLALSLSDRSVKRHRGRLRLCRAHRRARGFLARGAQARTEPPRGLREPRISRAPRHTAGARGPRAPRRAHDQRLRDELGFQGSARQAGHGAGRRPLCLRQLEVLREWAIAGLGIALKSTWDVYRHLQDGSLVELFPGYAFHSDVAIYAVYPHRRHLPAKTRVFIEFLAASFGPEPFWDRSAARALKPRIKGRAAV